MEYTPREKDPLDAQSYAGGSTYLTAERNGLKGSYLDHDHDKKYGYSSMRWRSTGEPRLKFFYALLYMVNSMCQEMAGQIYFYIKDFRISWTGFNALYLNRSS
jgi:hypothetical protein